MPRVLSWTGAAGNLDFGTPGNWTNQATGRAAKVAPGRATTVELSGEGTITGSGTVAVMDVIGGTSGFLFENAAISAATIVDTDGIALSDSHLLARNVTVGSGALAGTLVIGGSSTLSAIGGALDISVGSTEGTAEFYIGRNGGIGPALVALGGGTLQLGVGTGGGYFGVDEGGALTGGLRARIDFGGDSGYAVGTLTGGAIAIGGTIELGLQGGAGRIVLESGAISAGVLVLGVAGGYGGVLTATGGTVSAGVLEVGDGGAGTFSAMDASITVGRAGGVGLYISGAPSVPGGVANVGTLSTDSSTLTVKGATEIGLFGSGTLQFGGGPGSLTTNGGVAIGNYTDGGTGVLIDYGTWLDTGAVVVDNGQLELVGYGAAHAIINGDVTIGGGPAGALAIMTETYASITVNGTFDVAGSSVAQSMGDAVIGPSGTLSAKSVVVGGGAYDATLTVGGFSNGGSTTLDAGTLSVAAGSVLQMGPCLAQFGTSKAGVAASVSGSLLVTLATLTVTGGLDLNGPSADPTLLVEDHGTVSITSSGAAILCDDAGFEVLGSASVLTANGSVDLSSGSQGVVNAGTLTVSVAHGGTAMMIDATSMLSDSGTVTLTGGAVVGGQLLMQAGVFSASGELTVAAGGSVSGSGSVTASVNNMGSISAVGGSLSFMGSVEGAGTLSLGQGGALALLGAVGASATVDFATAGTITLGEAAEFHGAIGGWGSGDVLDLLQVAAVSDSVTGQVLTLYNSANDAVASLRFDQPITTSNFVLQQDGHGDTFLTYHS